MHRTEKGMTGYDSVDNYARRSSTRSTHSSDKPPPPPPHHRPHFYSSPVVSAPLITAFGLPTLIECDPPSSSPAPAPADEEGTPPFASLPGRKRSLSLPVYPAADSERAHRALSRSHIGSASEHAARSINAYTFRVRTNNINALSSNAHHNALNIICGADTSNAGSDGHRLHLSQNADGTYGHRVNSTTMKYKTNNVDAEFQAFNGEDEVAESDTGLLLSSKEPQDSSVSLDAVNELEETLCEMDKGTLPPHVHPSIPEEMLNPEFTRTAPPLKLWPLAVLVFYNVSGGPFGIEPSIRAGGNFFAILGFIVFPLVWSVPEALVTAELGAAFQDPSAGVAWVEEAFGETMACLCGYLAWVSGATDNAIYPTLFMEYVTSVAGWENDDFSGWTRFGVVALITICLAGLNYTGLEIVGNASMVVCVIAMSPFIILSIMAAPKVVPSRWFQMPEVSDEDGAELFDDDFQTSEGPLPLLTLGGILWRPYLNNLFWNLNSFDSAGSFSAETTSASTTYPRGIFIGLVMCVLAYLLPLLVAVGATDYSQSDWVDGHLGSVCVEIGGKWLGAWTIFAAAISNLALFEAEMSSDAFQLMGMAERGYLPKIFQTRSKYGTPTAGIIFNTIVVVAFGGADFGQLLELLNSVYALSLLMEYAAFVKLRLYHKELQRPYRIPVPDWAAVVIVIPPVLGILVIFATSNWWVYYFCTGTVVFGILLFKLSDIFKRLGWVRYDDRSPRSHKYAKPPLADENDVTETTEVLSAGSPADADP